MTDEPSDRQSLDQLDARLRAAREREDVAAGRAEPAEGSVGSGMGVGFRLATEMVSALVVGTLIGRWLDKWLGTAPWLLLLFFLLGAAAAMLSAYRLVSGDKPKGPSGSSGG